VGDNEIDDKKNAGESLAISIAMAMQRYKAGRITRQSTYRASLKATRCRYRGVPAPYCPVGRHGQEVTQKL
jgi:hypothetical protein